MTLKEIGDLVVLNAGTGFKARKFNHNRFEPDHAFKPLEKLELSYSTISQFKECQLKFAARKFVDMGFFKTNEALFLGNMVHKYAEDMINEYMAGNLHFDSYNQIARSHYEAMYKKFDKQNYPTEESMVEVLFKHIMGRKKFEPDVFFDDVSFLSTITRKRKNYVETNKAYFQHAAKLLKQLFGIAHVIKADKFVPEGWIKFPIEGTPVTFIGKVDLYFPYENKGQKYIGIVDFKTGKKEYFSWDQLNYYSLYWGEEQFSRVEKYFFDLREGERISYQNIVNYKDVYAHLKSLCEQINETHVAFNEVREELQAKYEKKLNGILRKANTDEIHKVPCDLVMMLLDVLNKEFFKARKIADYHSTGGFACTYCDILSYCPIRA